MSEEQDPLDLTGKLKKIDDHIERRKRETKVYDLRKVLETPEGRRVIWRVMELAGIFHGSFNQNALTMAFNEGKRDVGLVFIGEINANMPQRLTQMQNEYASDQRSERVEREKLRRARPPAPENERG